jgi:glycerol uptake facilitator-like aquaporin
MDVMRTSFVVRNRWAKVGLVLAVFIVSNLLGRLFDPVQGPLSAIVQTLLFTAGVLWLTRVFRGGAESDEPRPTWRMTATSGWSYGLATVWLIGAFVGVVLLVVGALTGATDGTARDMGLRPGEYTAEVVVQVVTEALLLVLFVRSGRRLRAHERTDGTGPV